MLKIGDFSKVCRVSVQTLRYYDKIGLMKADYVEDSSGYRYYRPEKVKLFQRITQLKLLDFSLEEIKRFLNAPVTEQCRMVERKKRSVLESMRRKQEQIKELDALCEDPGAGLMPITEQNLRVPFENDPQAVGKWVYVGNAEASRVFKDEEGLCVRDVLQKKLYFLPEGRPVWMYFWTKGTIYCVLREFNVIVPNPYRVFRRGNETYMEINWIADKFVDSVSDDSIRVYRQADGRAYSVLDTYDFRDDLDLPYRADERVTGEWAAVDILPDPSAFTADPAKWHSGPFWLAGLVFSGEGKCSKICLHGGRKTESGCAYTAGVLLDEQRGFAEHYRIVSGENADYLILEHKSGDYAYTGKVLCYYVFRRNKRQSDGSSGF